MAHFLLAWELGGAFGHLAGFRSLTRLLKSRGHSVTLALRDLRYSEEFFPDCSVLQAPTFSGKVGGRIAEPSTFADILSNGGWNEPANLAQLVTRWRHVFDETTPDVLIGDYAPTALLAAQGLTLRSVTFGTGFDTPPDVSPLPDLCPWRNNYPDRLRMTEQRVLRTLNSQLSRQGDRPMERVAQLFQLASACLLTTYREMDYYQGRCNGEYIGPWGELPGEAPRWADTPGPRVFAYLKPMEALPYLLQQLRRSGWPTLVYAPGAHEVASAFSSRTLRALDRPLDIEEVGRTCDLAILNAGHNATLRILLHGKPILALPLSGEQYLAAQNIESLGAGITVLPNQPGAAVAKLEQLSSEPQYRICAERFAARYHNVNRKELIDSVVKRLEEV